jgi:hypothetical protein
VWKIIPCDICYRKGRLAVGLWWNHLILFLPFWLVFFSIYFLLYCMCFYISNFHICYETRILHSLNFHFPSCYAHFYWSHQKFHKKNCIYNVYHICCFCCMYQFLNYMFKLNISWPFAVIWKKCTNVHV